MKRDGKKVQQNVTQNKQTKTHRGVMTAAVNSHEIRLNSPRDSFEVDAAHTHTHLGGGGA
jgi:hypothetical protein